MRAAAEPVPDDPDNCRDDEILMTRVPCVPKASSFLLSIDGERNMMAWSQYHDLLSKVLDCIREVRLVEHVCSYSMYSLLSGPRKKSYLEDKVAEDTVLSQVENGGMCLVPL